MANNSNENENDSLQNIVKDNTEVVNDTSEAVKDNTEVVNDNTEPELVKEAVANQVVEPVNDKTKVIKTKTVAVKAAKEKANTRKSYSFTINCVSEAEYLHIKTIADEHMRFKLADSYADFIKKAVDFAINHNYFKENVKLQFPYPDGNNGSINVPNKLLRNSLYTKIPKNTLTSF